MYRKFTAPTDGFSGVLCEGTRSPGRAVIYVGGGGATPDEAVRAGSFVRDAGFTVLVLGYYGWEGTPRKMENIPIEYASRAIRFLKNECGTRKIIMAGASEGAVYSLLCASFLPEINAVCAVAPLDFIMASPRAKGTVTSVYTWEGRALPFADFSLRENGAPQLLKGALSDKKYGFRRVIRYACDRVRPSADAFIKVENMNADLLIIVPPFDDIWGSEEAAKRIAARLAQNSYAHPFEILTLPGASHLMGGSYDISGLGMRLFRWALLKAEHDHPLTCDWARAECLDRMLSFFDRQ